MSDALDLHLSGEQRELYLSTQTLASQTLSLIAARRHARPGQPCAGAGAGRA